tara:strand:- start:13996 stop:15504 length:1509 start_codon:yes stop_codon:yes gene_type:complete
MNDLNAITSTFSTDEALSFISYLEKKNKRIDTKNIQLFKYLLKDEYTSKDICYKLYGNTKTNAYHALRKRLYQSIIDFIANVSLQEENSMNMQIIKHILASRKCFTHKQYKVAFKILDKAELLAIENHLFPYLNEIYHTKIQYAHANPTISLDTVISKFKRNQKNNVLEDELNMVYAKVRKTLNSITYQGAIIDFQTILNNILKEHNISINDSMSFKSLYQLMSIFGLSAFVTNDYLKTEPFLINTYKSIINHKNKDKSVYYHIQILYLIANTLFRNKKFEDSQRYLDLMHQEMQSLQKKYYTTFKLKYHLLLALNLNYSNKQEDAINSLIPFINIKHEDTETLLDIHLSWVMFNFQKENYKQAASVLSKFYHTDGWYIEKSGKEWVIKKNLIDILLNIELENIDLVESRLLSFKRTYTNYLKDIKQERVLTYLTFIESYYKNPEIVTSIRFKETVESSFEWVEKQREDIFVMSFYAWLKSKMENEKLYDTTLNLINTLKKR